MISTTTTNSSAVIRAALPLVLSQPNRVWRMLGDAVASMATDVPEYGYVIQSLHWLELKDLLRAKRALEVGAQVFNGGRR